MRPVRLLLAGAAAAFLAGQAAAAGKQDAPGLPGLIDKVLVDPSDAEARARVKNAAELADEKEAAAAAAEKADLLAGAEADRKKVLAMREQKERRRLSWKRSLDRACSLASDQDSIKEAVSAYEDLLENSPVYSDNREELTAGLEKVKNAFFKTIKSGYPHLVQGRDHIDERDIASLLFSRASTQDDYGRYNDTGSTQEVLDKADKFRQLEKELSRQYANLTKGLGFYSRKHYGEALGLFNEVLAFDRGNEEALFYWALARKNIKLSAGDQAVK